tara:strand:- start:943 stop:1203 length:261 start_codon:yes stop_codon:yes gene_type:complete
MRSLILLAFLLGAVQAPSLKAIHPHSNQQFAEAVVRTGIAHGSGLTKGMAYSEALVKLPSSSQVYRRLTYGAKGSWSVALFWKIER